MPTRMEHHCTMYSHVCHSLPTSFTELRPRWFSALFLVCPCVLLSTMHPIGTTNKDCISVDNKQGLHLWLVMTAKVSVWYIPVLPWVSFKEWRHYMSWATVHNPSVLKRSFIYMMPSIASYDAIIVFDTVMMYSCKY